MRDMKQLDPDMNLIEPRPKLLPGTPRKELCDLVRGISLKTGQRYEESRAARRARRPDRRRQNG